MTKRICVFVDGENFRHSIVDLFNEFRQEDYLPKSAKWKDFYEFLTNKVDRSVGGLVAQQQCVGPFHTPLANCAVTAQSFFSKNGIAISIGEQPIKGLLDPEKMARLTVGEMLTNLMWAPVTNFTDIKCSGNWMWEKKYPDELYALYQAVASL